MKIVAACAADGAAIETLLDATFGPARHARTAYRLRAGALPLAAASLAAHDSGRLVGSVQCWPLALVAAGGAVTPLTLLGPLAVAPDRQGQGIGKALLAAVLAEVDARRLPPVMLIGDHAYYAPFGFGNAATAGWRLPGPVDQARVLVRSAGAAALPATGWLRPVPAGVAQIAA